MMNKDAEGIKYIAQKDNQQYLLKIFYKSSLINVHTLFSLQMRLDRLNHLKDKHTAKVVKIDPHHDPAYMVTEYIHGVSLAHIKQHNPEKLTENLVRNIAKQLIQTAIVVRNEKLTLSKLSLANVMMDDHDNAVILSSAITYEDRDERDDLFIIGSVLAQLLSKHALYGAIYSAERLAVQKFAYIAGISVSFNRILGESLHRNILQRYLSLEDSLTAIESLPPIESDELWSIQEKNEIGKLEDINAIDEPKTQIEFGFWLLVIIVVGMLIALLTTNIYSVIFGVGNNKLHYTGLLGTKSDPDSVAAPEKGEVERSGSPIRTAYGDLKTSSVSDRVDFRKQSPITRSSATPYEQATPRSKAPTNMKYIDATTLGFGRLKDNLHHNVSLSSFYISPREVTQAEWSRFMKPANSSAFGDNLPVDNVSWFDIAIYCNGRSEAENLTLAYKIRGVGASRVVTCDLKANGYRLPTEAEWELAAKAGELFNYSGSDEPDEISWFRENSGGKIKTPGTKSPNGYGLYDMTGNVAEWCWDWFDANYIRSLPTFINPSGPDTGTQKTIRGGSITNGEGRNLNILWREKGDPNRGYQYVGF
ncbi:MAG: SUMF1/EgtB/PvdO family nonheme iron enzyme, partial [Candidatus Cloacimonetes bacterium]|nr:SUMF1/EgtB/PvdO family nonheme iron enzyme [Candidatus Cloacimonadota bacterium]